MKNAEKWALVNKLTNKLTLVSSNKTEIDKFKNQRTHEVKLYSVWLQTKNRPAKEVRVFN